MVANQTKCFKIEQRFVIKFFVAETCKPGETYRRICDVFREETCFSQNNGLPQ